MRLSSPRGGPWIVCDTYNRLIGRETPPLLGPEEATESFICDWGQRNRQLWYRKEGEEYE